MELTYYAGLLLYIVIITIQHLHARVRLALGRFLYRKFEQFNGAK